MISPVHDGLAGHADVQRLVEGPRRVRQQRGHVLRPEEPSRRPRRSSFIPRPGAESRSSGAAQASSARCSRNTTPRERSQPGRTSFTNVRSYRNSIARRRGTYPLACVDASCDHHLVSVAGSRPETAPARSPVTCDHAHVHQLTSAEPQLKPRTTLLDSTRRSRADPVEPTPSSHEAT